MLAVAKPRMAYRGAWNVDGMAQRVRKLESMAHSYTSALKLSSDTHVTRKFYNGIHVKGSTNNARKRRTRGHPGEHNYGWISSWLDLA